MNRQKNLIFKISILIWLENLISEISFSVSLMAFSENLIFSSCGDLFRKSQIQIPDGAFSENLNFKSAIKKRAAFRHPCLNKFQKSQFQLCFRPFSGNLNFKLQHLKRYSFDTTCRDRNQLIAVILHPETVEVP